MKRYLADGHPPFVCPLEPRLPANVAVSRLLAGLTTGLLANAALIPELDGEEPLHDYRVALRRTRTVRSLLGGPREFGPWLRDTARRTSRARDLDVLLRHLAGYLDDRVGDGSNGATESPTKRVADRDYRLSFEALRRRLRAERDEEYDSVCRWLSTADYRNQLRSWQAVIEQLGNQPGSDLPRKLSGHELEAVLKRAVAKVMKRIQKRVRALETTEAAARLGRIHRIRVEGKKLRYLLEFSQVATPTDANRERIVALEALQDRLGHLQDLACHRDYLAALAGEFATPDGDLAGSLAGQLASRLDELVPDVERALTTFFPPEPTD